MDKELKEWLQRLLDIAVNINEPRGTQDAPPRYSLQYLFGYIESGRSFLNRTPNALHTNDKE